MNKLKTWWKSKTKQQQADLESSLVCLTSAIAFVPGLFIALL
jgi:hypothetical protein